LHKDLDKILDFINRNNKIAKCQIATNATVVPSAQVSELLKNNKKFSVRLSRYGDVNKDKIELMMRHLDINSIPYRCHRYVRKIDMWTDMGDFDMTKKSTEEGNEIFKTCGKKNCLTLENGFLGRCSRAAVAHYMQKFELKKSDGIHVRTGFSDEAFWDFCIAKRIVSACYYCNGTLAEPIFPGEQFNKQELLDIKAMMEGYTLHGDK